MKNKLNWLRAAALFVVAIMITLFIFTLEILVLSVALLGVLCYILVSIVMFEKERKGGS